MQEIVKLSNSARQDIIDRKKLIDDEDEMWRKAIEIFLDCLCTRLPDEKWMEELYKEIKSLTMNMRKMIDNYVAFEKEGLRIGRMLSRSKSDYREKNPDHLVCFNANVFSSEGKIWYGDLDLDIDGEKLQSVADELGKKLFVLREMDGRFENESLSEIKVIQKAIYTTK